jgi:hypothetical protein
MTERYTGVFYLRLLATFLTVSAVTSFVCLLSQGSLHPNLVSADSVLQDDAGLRSVRQPSRNFTDVNRMPTAVLVEKPSAASAGPAPALKPNVLLARLDADDRQTKQPPQTVPFEQALHPARTELLPFETAPFPYSSQKRGIQRAKQTYNDSRVLLHIPPGFDANRPGVIVVFFHGHRTMLERDVWGRQQVPAQVSAAGINAVLVAPQFAVDAADSNPGKFAEPGAFARFLDEAAKQLARLNGDAATEETFAKMPVVLVAYSGGFVPCAWAIHVGSIGSRIQGIVLLDALYGELDKFIRWITKANQGFFVSAFTQSTRRQNNTLEQILAEKKVAYDTELGRNWRQGVTFISTGSDVNHRDYVTRSWTENPIQDVLARLDEYKLPR